MEKVKKFLLRLTFLIIPVMLLGGCGRKAGTGEEKMETDFPVEEDGYPKSDLIVVNGKSYPLYLPEMGSREESELDIKLEEGKSSLEVILPQVAPNYYRYFDEGEFISLLSYKKIDLPIREEDERDGPSSTVQDFSFRVSGSEKSEILLKWANVNEGEKPFKDKKEDYLLKLSVHY